MIIVIDRFEEGLAVCELENGEMVNISRKIIPEEAKEGDIIELMILHDDTEIRRRKLEKRLNDLLED